MAWFAHIKDSVARTRALVPAAVVLALLLLAAGVAVATTPAGSSTGAEADDDPTRLRGRAGAEAAARQLAADLGAPQGDDGEPCPPERLAVGWEAPDDDYEAGAHLVPLGPPPTAATTAVNGIVTCRGSQASYLGFDARWVGWRWVADGVPAADESEAAAAEPVTPARQLPAGRNQLGLGSPWAGRWGPDIEDLAAFEPQTRCSPGAQPGVLVFAELVRRAFPGTADLGIVRPCPAGARSEHKEGRAWDWGARADRPDQSQAVQELLAWLLATDEHGNRYAMARRLGVMYVIWDRHIWSSYRAAEGWRPYGGPSAHTDHVHLSFGWDGAQGRTSFWDGVPLPAAPGPLGWPVAGAWPDGFALGGPARAELGADPGAPVGGETGNDGDQQVSPAGEGESQGTSEPAPAGEGVVEPAPEPEPSPVPAPDPTEPVPLPPPPELTVPLDTTTTTTTTLPPLTTVVPLPSPDDLLSG